MPVSFKKKRPVKKLPVKAKIVKKEPTPERVTVKVSGIQRPVARMFECLVHAEQALKHIEQIGVFTGPDVEKMQEVKGEARNVCNELKALYRKYWKSIVLEGEEG